jgi:hypothetical protein
MLSKKNMERQMTYMNLVKSTAKRKLFNAGVRMLEEQGWFVERQDNRSSVCTISKGNITKIVSITTTRDQWISCIRSADDTRWITWDSVDDIVIVSVDNKDNPKYALVHNVPAQEVLTRFDKALAARKAAGHKSLFNHGTWVSLYEEETSESTVSVGGGIGLKYTPVASYPLFDEAKSDQDKPLTIAKAKELLSQTFGVTPEQIQISINA